MVLVWQIWEVSEDRDLEKDSRLCGAPFWALEGNKPYTQNPMFSRRSMPCFSQQCLAPASPEDRYFE